MAKKPEKKRKKRVDVKLTAGEGLVRKLRGSQGLTQKDLAFRVMEAMLQSKQPEDKELTVSARTIDRMEKGIAVSEKSFLAVAKFFGLTVEQLTGKEPFHLERAGGMNNARSSLLKYREQMVLVHGKYDAPAYKMEERDDIPLKMKLEEVYVPIQLGEEEIPPHKVIEEPKEGEALLNAVKANRLLVLLGPGGSGKTTSMAYIATRLCQEEVVPNEWQMAMGSASLPILLKIRDLELTPESTCEDVLKQYVAKGPGKYLSQWEIVNAMEQGQAVFLVDGLDELSEPKRRERLRHILWRCMRVYPQCRFVITSRVVGYGEDPVDRDSRVEKVATVERDTIAWKGSRPFRANVDSKPLTDFLTNQELRDPKLMENKPPKGIVTKYVQPFTRGQISDYIYKWNLRRFWDRKLIKQVVEELAKEEMKRFCDLLFSLPNALEMGRVPHFLSYLAVMHVIDRTLPEGRVKLLYKITEIYLEQIPRERKDGDIPVTIEMKRKRLGYVAYKMQCARDHKGTSGITISYDELWKWLHEIMGERPSGIELTAKEKADLSLEVSKFLSFMQNRSGLLYEKEPGKFGFSHLSVQDYLAAVYMLQKLQRRGASYKEQIKEFRKHLGEAVWEETWVFFFEEAFERHNDQHDQLFDHIWGVRWNTTAKARGKENAPGVEWETWGLENFEATKKLNCTLLNRLVGDGHSGVMRLCSQQALSQAGMARGVCGIYAMYYPWPHLEEKVKALPEQSGRNLKKEEQQQDRQSRAWLNYMYEGAKRWKSLRPASDLEMGFWSLPPRCELSHFEAFTDLESLYVYQTPIDGNLASLKGMKSMRCLYLPDGQIEGDIAVFSEMTQLTDLNCFSTKVQGNIAAISGLVKLTKLDLDGTEVEGDISALAQLVNLKWLYLTSTKVAGNIASLAPLVKLSSIGIENTKIQGDPYQLPAIRKR